MKDFSTVCWIGMNWYSGRKKSRDANFSWLKELAVREWPHMVVTYPVTWQ